MTIRLLARLPAPDRRLRAAALLAIGVLRVLSTRALRAALLEPAAPMPSFQNLPRAKLNALIVFGHDLH